MCTSGGEKKNLRLQEAKDLFVQMPEHFGLPESKASNLEGTQQVWKKVLRTKDSS